MIDWQTKAEVASHANLTGGKDFTSMGADDILHKRQSQSKAFAAAPQNCDSLPGSWTGGEGKVCGESPLNDLYSFAWAVPPKQGSWVPTMESGGGWGTGLGQFSPDNSTTTVALDSGVNLNGNVTGNCSCIAWDNGSWWMKKGPAPPPITDVHIIAMNLLPEGADRDPIDTVKHETLLAADVLSCRLGNVIG